MKVRSLLSLCFTRFGLNLCHAGTQSTGSRHGLGRRARQLYLGQLQVRGNLARTTADPTVLGLSAWQADPGSPKVQLTGDPLGARQGNL